MLLLVVSALVISAGMLTVIQAPIGWSFLAWGAYVPFAVACTPRISGRRLVLLTFGVGFLYWLGNVYWIAPITLIGWLGMGFYLAWFWPLLAIPVRFCRAKGVPMFLALPILVVGSERLTGFPLGGFFWRFLGHSQYANLPVIQVADLVGAAGVSFLVAIVNGLLADLVLFWRSGKLRNHDISKHRIPYGLVLGPVATVVAVAMAVGYGHWRLDQTGDHLKQGPRVAALQSNVPQSVKRSFSKSGQLFDDLMVSSKAAAATNVDLIVWPETMVQGLLEPKLWPVLTGNLDEAKAFHQALCEHAKDNAYLLVGALGGKVLRNPAGEPYLGNYNSAYLYRPDGTQDPQRYDKIHLVLFGEYTPFRRTFPWLFQQLGRFLPEGYNVEYSLEHGTNYTIFDMTAPVRKGEPNSPAGQSPAGSVKAEGLGDGSTVPVADHREAALDDATPPQSDYHFAVIICYEDTIPYVARNFVLDEHGRKRIDWLVNISNDGWFVRFKKNPDRVIPSTELPQHAAICAFRAVENRLPILRSVNTGISCLIESTGRIRDGYLAASDGFPVKAMDRTGLTGWFSDKMPIDTRVTFYSRHGEWFADGCSAILVALVFGPPALRFIRRRTAKAAR
jgi:apolipoprotein N-acyltransferase